MPHKVCNRLLDFESTSGLLPHYIFMLGAMQCVRMVTLSLCQWSVPSGWWMFVAIYETFYLKITRLFLLAVLNSLIWLHHPSLNLVRHTNMFDACMICVNDACALHVCSYNTNIIYPMHTYNIINSGKGAASSITMISWLDLPTVLYCDLWPWFQVLLVG